jgi:hypothetical protein
LILAATAVFGLSLFSCGTTDKVEGSGIKAKDPKVATAKVVLDEWQGSEMGGEIPQWVIELANGNYGEAALAKVMPDIKGKKTFVTIGYGDNLDFVRQWTDLVDIETEVASTLSRVAAKAVQAEMQGKGGESGQKRTDPTTTEKTLNMYRTSLTSVRFSGLEKQAQFWTLSHKVRGKEEFDQKYSYYSVWTIDKKMFEDQLNAAMKNIDDTSTEEKALKDMVRQRLADQLSVHTNDSAEDDKADAEALK